MTKLENFNEIKKIFRVNLSIHGKDNSKHDLKSLNLSVTRLRFEVFSLESFLAFIEVLVPPFPQDRVMCGSLGGGEGGIH